MDPCPRELLIIEVPVTQWLVEVVMELLVHDSKHVDVPFDLFEVLDAF